MRKCKEQLNSTDAAGRLEEWEFHCCGLSSGRPTRERPAAVIQEKLGVDGLLDFLHPPLPLLLYSVITLVIYNVQKTNAMSAETFPHNRCPEHTISHYITNPLQGQRDLIAAYSRPKVLCHLFPHSASFQHSTASFDTLRAAGG